MREPSGHCAAGARGSWSAHPRRSLRVTLRVAQALSGVLTGVLPHPCTISSHEGTQSATEQPLGQYFSTVKLCIPPKYLKDPFLKQDSDSSSLCPRGPSPMKSILLKIPVSRELLSPPTCPTFRYEKISNAIFLVSI